MNKYIFYICAGLCSIAGVKDGNCRDLEETIGQHKAFDKASQKAVLVEIDKSKEALQDKDKAKKILLQAIETADVEIVKKTNAGGK